MAITAAKARVRHGVVVSTGEDQMRKTTLFAVAAAVLIATCFGLWAAAPSNARIPTTGRGIDTLQVTMNAKGLPTEEFTDYQLSYS
jgi:hypothetical protein